MANTAEAAGTPPPFDPSKPSTPYDVSKAPKFDPSKPSTPYNPANLPMTPASTGRAAKGQSTEKISGDVAEKMGFDPEVNYVAGTVPMLTQATLKTADNPEEAQAIMEYFFGKGNYGQDKGGRWWGTVNGKKTAIFTPYGGEIIPGMIGTAPITAGATLGAFSGAEFGPGGAVVGAGAGGMLGKAVDEARKAALGQFKKTAGQEALTLAKTAVENAAFQAGGELVSAGLSSAGPMVRGVIGKPTAEGAAMAGKLLESGARPPIVSAAPGAKVLQYDQMLRNLIKGNPQEARNVLYIQNEIKQMLRNEGISDKEIESMMQEVSDTGAAVSSRGAGESAVNSVVKHHEALVKNADAAIATAKQEIGRTDKLMRTLAKQAPGDLGTTVAVELQASRRAFGQQMNAVYDNIDRVVGGAAVIPTFLLKRAIAPIVKNLPPEKIAGIFKEITELPPSVSIKQMQRYRTRLRELADGGLTPDIDQHLMGDAARAADASFDKAFFANPPDTRPLLNILKGVFGELPSEKAVRLLRDADAMYGEGIAKYRDASMTKLTQQARSGIPPDPRVVADTIIQPGQTERAKTILSLLTPETRKAVAAADMQNIVRDAARATGGEGSRVIEGDALLKVLDDRGALLDAVYGPVYGEKFVGTITEQAKRLAAIDGKVDISALKPGQETLAIEDAIQKTTALDSFVKDNYLSVLRSGRPQDVDRAMRLIIQPGNEAKLETAVKMLGPQAVQDMRRYALKSILAKAMVEMPSRVRTIGGSGIDEALKRLTPKQQQLLFPDGLLEDMQTIAKEARFLFPWETGEGGRDFGGSLAAAEIKAHVPFSIKSDLAYIKRAFFGWIADRETTIRLLSTGLREPGPKQMLARQALKVLGRNFLNSMFAGPGSGSPQEQQNGP